MLTKKEVVIQTIELLKKYGRASQDGECLYIMGSKRCGFGLWLEDPECFYDIIGSSSLLSQHGQYILKEQVRHIVDPNFWQKLQILHDTSYHWTSDNTLTKEGKKYVKNTFDIYIKA